MARICKFVNQSSSFPELFLDLTTTEPEPELFSFGLFGGAGARAGKARQARLELEPRSGSLDISETGRHPGSQTVGKTLSDRQTDMNSGRQKVRQTENQINRMSDRDSQTDRKL